MNSYSNGNKKGKRKIKNLIKKNKIKLIGVIGAVGLMSVLPAREYREYQEKNKIESNADIEVNREFRNIKTANMGKYLESEIERLYEKYPDLDNMILDGTEETGNIEFINDIYRLYKAFIVDESEKEVEDIEDVKVKLVDQLILQSDSISEGDKEITRTHKEQYKMITDDFLKAKESRSQKDGARFAKRVYELLALELGLEDNVLTSQEIQEVIENEGIYYDEENNTVYTKGGRGHIAFDKKYDKEKVEVEKQTEIIGKEDKGFEIDD